MTTARKLESSAPRERPILFSGPMVRAILEGRKTQTRRVVKPKRTVAEGIDRLIRGEKSADIYGACPYGAPGDLLRARETWLRFECPGHQDRHLRCDCEATELVRYAADCPEMQRAMARWRPSIHMPRWASRLLLEVTEVRVQRLQDISEEDARAEGAEDIRYRTAKECFSDLWFCLHGDGAWAANPWVWAITFKRVEAKEVAA